MRLSYENQGIKHFREIIIILFFTKIEFQSVQNPNYIIKPSIMNTPQNFISNQTQSM